MSEAVLGETGSTNQSGGGGSRARDEVGNSVRLELVKADSDLLSGTINSSLVRWITALNVPGANPPRVWRDCQEPEDLQSRATRDKLIVDMGFKPTLRYVHETYGGEWVESLLSPPTPNLPFAACPSCGSASFAESGATTPDRQIETLETAAATALAPMIDTVRALLDEAQSLPDLRDRLLAAWPQINADQLAEVMGEALLAAQLAGSYEILEGL